MKEIWHSKKRQNSKCYIQTYKLIVYFKKNAFNKYNKQKNNKYYIPLEIIETYYFIYNEY